MLSESLCQNQCETHHADGNTELIVMMTAQSARIQTTVPIGNDTDLLILPLYLTPKPKSNSLKRRVWNIKKLQAEIGTEICNNILFIHTVLGCDTTSRVHGIGKDASN